LSSTPSGRSVRDAPAARSVRGRGAGFLRGVLIGWLCHLPVAVAADSRQLSEQDYLGDLPVVLSATRLSQPLSDTPVAMTVIDRAMIEASGARTIPDLLRLVPGMVVGMQTGYNAVASYHGMADRAGRRMQVLVDGRSVYTPSLGGVPWADLPLALEDIERIEVIRGPNAATYGANAFLGTVSITTRHSAVQPDEVKARIGTHGIRDALARHAGKHGNLDYRLTAGHDEDRGFDLRHDTARSNYATARGDYRIDVYNTLELQFGYKGGDRQRESENPPWDVRRDREVISRYGQARWRYALDSGNELSVQLYHNYHESDERYTIGPGLPPPALPTWEIPIVYDVVSERLDLELQHTLSPTSNLRLAWGAGAREDRVVAPGFFRGDGRVENDILRAFGSAEWRIAEPLLLNTGVMIEKNDITGTDTSPRLAVNYRLWPGHTVRYGISRATRNPVLVEEMGYAGACIDPPVCSMFIPTLVASGGLKPETILSREIGYVGNLAAGWVLDMKFFRDHIDRLIAEIDRPAVPVDVEDYANANYALVTGFELALDARLTPATRAVIGYAYVDIDSEDRFAARYSVSMPRNSGSLLLMHDLSRRFQASLAYYYRDAMRFIDQKPLGVARRLDLRLAARLPVGRSEGEAALIVQNALDSYDEYYPRSRLDNQFDTRVFVTLGWRFF
jgi:iron complex outermembrane recepter protein